MTKGQAEATCRRLLEVLESEGDAPHYICMMLEDVNWRPQIVACVAALLSRDRSAYVGPMWRTFDAGSWIAPQLAVVLSYCDPEFELNAKQRISAGCPVVPPAELDQAERHSATGPAGVAARSGKNMASLLAVLTATDTDTPWLWDVQTKRDTWELLDEDIDDSGKIARKWMNRVRDTLEPLGIDL
jgi:hypothetical protein